LCAADTGARSAWAFGSPERARAIIAVTHDIAEVDKWEQAHFEEDELRTTAKEAKAKYEDALRSKFFGS
jgi:hypothetical protein